MEYLSLFWIVFAIFIPALIMPGPDFIITVRNSLTYSKKVWLYTALWLSLGYFTFIFYSIIWLTFILWQSEIFLNILKFSWAFYLIYLWYMISFSKSKNIDFNEKKEKKSLSNYWAIKMWFINWASNPKSMLFFLSIFTLAIKPETPDYIIQLLLWSIWLVYTIWYTLVAILFSQKKVQNLFNRFQKILNKIFWWILASFWALVLFYN